MNETSNPNQNCCIIWGYADVFSKAVNYFIKSERRKLFSDIYLYVYETGNSVTTSRSKFGELIHYVPIKNLYALTNCLNKNAKTVSENEHEKTSEANFADFTLYCDRTSIVPSSQMHRHRIYKKLMEYFNNLVFMYKDVFIYFESVPHYPAEYLLDKCADSHQKSTKYYSHDTALSNYFLVTESLEHKIDATKFIKLDSIALETNGCSIGEWLPDASKFIKNLGSPSIIEQAKFEGGVITQFTESLNDSSKILRNYTAKQYIDLFSDQINNIAESGAAGFSWNSGLLTSSSTDARKIRKIYEDYIEASYDLLEYYNYISLDENIIRKKIANSCYIPLHMQPERSTLPDGGIYFDQIRFIQDIRSRLDIEHPILIKEHPVQFIQKFPNPQHLYFRTKDFYDEIRLIPNTYFIPLNFNQMVLIKNALIVATVTGTSGWQSILLGKPMIYGGYPWYGAHPKAYNIKELNSIQINDLVKDSSKKIAFLETIEFYFSLQSSLHRAGWEVTESQSPSHQTISGWGEALVSLSRISR